MNVYYQIRSSQLDRSIKGLKEHFRKSSSSSGVPYSPAIPNKRKDTPTKKPIKRPGEPAPRPIQPQPEGCVGPASPSAALGLAASALPELVLTGTPGCRYRGQKAGDSPSAEAPCSRGHVSVCQPQSGEARARGCWEHQGEKAREPGAACTLAHPAELWLRERTRRGHWDPPLVTAVWGECFLPVLLGEHLLLLRPLTGVWRKLPSGSRASRGPVAPAGGAPPSPLRRGLLAVT